MRAVGAPSSSEGRKLEDLEASNSWNPSVVGQKRPAADAERRRKLDRVRPSEASGCAEIRTEFKLFARHVGHCGCPECSSATACGQRAVAGTTGHDEQLEQRKRRGDSCPCSAVGFFKQGINEGQVPRILFDEVDEDGRVYSDRPGTHIAA